MGLNFEQYKAQRLTVFKEKNNRFVIKLRRILLTSLIVPVVINLDIVFLKSPNSILSIIAITVYSFIFGYWLALSLKEQPSYKEYLVYYFWMGKNFLDRYEKEGASNEDRKKALYYFQSLSNQLNRFVPTTNRFETEKPMNKSIKLFNQWVSRFVIPSFKKGKIEETYLKINEVFETSFLLLQDENFIELEKYLTPIVQPHLIKLKNPIRRFIEWLYSSQRRCLVFYAIMLLSGFSIVIYVSYSLGLGLSGILGFCGILTAVVAVTKLIQSHLAKKFQTDIKK